MVLYKPNAAKNHQNRSRWQGRIATGAGTVRMSDISFDFAIFGATPLAQLLAGLLASAHGRKVLLVGESQSGYRLPRGIDLSVAPVTRPETWSLLGQSVPETARLVSRIAGRSGIGRVDPIFFAQRTTHVEALFHIRHMAEAFGIAAERAAPSHLGEGRQGVILRDAIRIHRPALDNGIGTWLDRSQVRRTLAEKVSVAADGRAEIFAGGTVYLARQAVLADDDAVMAWLPLRQWPALLRRQHRASILTTPARPLAAPLMYELDSGTVLTQQAEGGIAAFGPGDLAEFSGRIQALLGHQRRVEQAGQTRFKTLVSLDGAPVFGRASGVGADVIAALGQSGAFLAPPLARWLAGQASAEETAWFAARLVNRVLNAAPVDDYVAGPQEAAT